MPETGGSVLMQHSFLINDGLEACPLCGRKVAAEVMGKLHEDVPNEILPVYHVRCQIKCQTEFLTLDLAKHGYVDANVADQLGALEAIMKDFASQVISIWNNRTGGR
jgi:hypothetical protein